MPVKLNLNKTLESTASNSIFTDVPKDGEVRVRFLPPMEGSDGALWFLTENHFRLKAEDGERSIAVACRRRHADGDDCFLCDIAKALADSSDASEKALGRGRNSIAANRSWYAQVLPIVKEDGEFVAREPKLLRLPKTAAEAVNSIMQTQQRNDEELACSPEATQDIVVKRDDTGSITKYSAMPAGKPRALADLMPDWENKIMGFDKVWEKLDIKLFTNEEQIEAMERSYPGVDVAGFAEALGYK